MKNTQMTNGSVKPKKSKNTCSHQLSKPNKFTPIVTGSKKKKKKERDHKTKAENFGVLQRK